MSYTCSQELGVESSLGTCLGTDASEPLSASPTPSKSCSPVSETEACRPSQSSATCEISTVDPTPAALTSWLEGFPAKTSPSPETAPAWTVSDRDSGERWPGSFARFDPASYSWRTAQRSLLGGWESFSETWPRWGSMRAGECFLRPMSAPPTSASGSGFWPTPVASDTGQRKKKYAQGGTALSLAVRLYPTPTAGNHKSGGYLGEWGGSRARERMREMVPPEEMFGPLNPEWVEWLMGFPTGWTDLRPSGMLKFREWRQQHGNY